MDGPSEAARARKAGNYAEAAQLYAAASDAATTVAERLHLMMRHAYCLVDIGQQDKAVALVTEVVADATAADELPVLCDALSLLVDDHMMNDRIGEATKFLADARYVLDQLPETPNMQYVIHNVAVTYERCDLPESALELFARSLALTDEPLERSFVLAGMAVAHHLGLIYAADPVQRERHIADGLRVTAEALEDPESSEVIATLSAQAHRAAFLNAQGDHAEALRLALVARKVAEAQESTTELVVAMLAEAVARWRLDRDPVCIELIERASDLATGPWTRRFPASAWPVQLEALWETGQLDRLRAALGHRQRVIERDLRRERAGRLAHIELGVTHRRTQRMSVTDPLTGLYNRRYLGQVLPEALANNGPVCVAVFDLDGFKVINDQFSYGHGDRVIQQVSMVLDDACRRGDFLLRLGGDEFVMVLCQIMPDHARGVLDRIARQIRETHWDGLPPETKLTASVGVAVGRGIADTHRVIAEANAALRIAKQTGRDRIVFG